MRRTILTLALLALAGAMTPSGAQTVRGERFQLSTGPCTLRSGSGVPSTSLGVVCDTYIRTDSPYTVYIKTGGSTWSEIYRAGGTDVAVADGGTGLSSWTTGHLVYASGTTTLAGTATPSVTSLTATGAVQGATVTGTTSVTTPTLTASGNLTLSPTGDVVLAPTGADILPNTGYSKHLGAATNKFLTLHAAELWVDTLVANSTMATIGGRILVGPTTELTSDLGTGDTSIAVKHNQMVSGDRVFMESAGAVEFLAITSGPSGTGPYTYSVTRNLDGTGANAWTAGDAVFNTGQTGSGFMDLFSLGSAAFPGYSAVFNFDAALSAFSANYFETDVWPIFGDAANNTVNDAVYFGSPAVFGTLSAYAITPVTSSSTLVWEFWNGTAWTTFTPTGAGFGAVGPGAITLGTLSGWATTTVNGVNAYYIRLRISALGGGTTAGVWRQTRRGPQQWGPTILGNVRVSSTYNDWYPRWAIGNLNGTYGYGSQVFGAAFGDEAATNITIDATNGIRIRNGTTNKLVADTSGNLSIVGDLSVGSAGVIRSGATSYASGTGYVLDFNGGTPRMRVGTTAGNRLQWDGSNLTLVSANATIDSAGINIAPATTYDTTRSYGFTVATGAVAIEGADNGGVGIGRSLRMRSAWTGVGNLTNGVGATVGAYHQPSSGGTSRTCIGSFTADSSQAVLTLSGCLQVITDATFQSLSGSNVPFQNSIAFVANGAVSSGGVGRDATNGMMLYGSSGSTYDWFLANRSGSGVIANVGNTVEIQIASVSGDGSGKVLCVKADTSIGTCNATTIGTSTCTCG